MAKRIWDAEPNIDEHYGKFRIRIWKNDKFIINETIDDSDVTRKSDLARVIKIRNKYLARLTLNEPVRSKATRSKPKKDNNLITFSQAAERYLKIYARDLDSASIADYRKHLNSYWIPAFGSWLMCDIEEEDILEYFVDLEEQGTVYKTKTKKNYCQSLSNVFTALKLDSPVNKLWGGKSRLANEKAKISRYVPDEVEALIDACEVNGRAGFNIKLYFTIFIGCGLRPQELLALKWDDFDGEFLTIQRCVSDHKIKETTKTGRIRRVYVPNWVRNELRNAPSRFGKTWVFPNTVNGFNVKAEIFNEEWRRVHKNLKIPYKNDHLYDKDGNKLKGIDLTEAKATYQAFLESGGEEQNRTPYTCRHTRAAELLSQGVPPGKGAEQLGHSVLVFLNTYSEWIDEYSKTDNSLLESQNKSSFVRNLSETAKNDV